MNRRTLYENLDTAFVNLSALVKYLRHREFIGLIRVELNNYEADIALFEKNKIGVREHDKISGRISDGEEAFQRLLIRAREAGGTIHVYQSVSQSETKPKSVENKIVSEPKVESPTPPIVIAEPIEAVKPPIEPIKKAAVAAVVTNTVTANVVKLPEAPKKAETLANHLKFPFDLGKTINKKNRQSKISEQDWQILLNLTGELLATVDKSLAEAKLDFKSAFSKVRSEIAPDYPFLSPSSDNFAYKDGNVSMSSQVSDKLFVTSIVESLRKILDKLGANPKFSNVYRNIVQKILSLIHQRQTYYDKFSITPQLKKVLGV